MMLKVIVPPGLDVEPGEGQEWNAATRTLSWKFHEMEKDAVRAVHFQLKVGKFLPNAPTERQAAAKLFDVALFRGPLKDGAIPVVQNFPDVSPKDWSFGWVEEAAMVAHEAEHKGAGIERLIRYLPSETKQM